MGLGPLWQSTQSIVLHAPLSPESSGPGIVSLDAEPGAVNVSTLPSGRGSSTTETFSRLGSERYRIRTPGSTCQWIPREVVAWSPPTCSSRTVFLGALGPASLDA